MKMQNNHSKIIINFAGDEEALKTFAKYIKDKQIFENDANVIIESDDVVFQIPKTTNYLSKKKEIKSLLKNFLKEFYKFKDILEFQNIFVVGITKHLTEISDIVQCEICGFSVNTEEELLIHRRMHGMI